jgi:hypothetical protein
LGGGTESAACAEFPFLSHAQEGQLCPWKLVRPNTIARCGGARENGGWLLFLFYTIGYFVMTFCNVALVAVAVPPRQYA